MSFEPLRNFGISEAPVRRTLKKWIVASRAHKWRFFFPKSIESCTISNNKKPSTIFYIPLSNFRICEAHIVSTTFVKAAKETYSWPSRHTDISNALTILKILSNISSSWIGFSNISFLYRYHKVQSANHQHCNTVNIKKSIRNPEKELV